MYRLRSHKFRRTTLMALFCMALLGGVGLAHSGGTLAPLWCWLLGVTVAYKLRARTLTTLILVILLGVSLGWWRGSAYMHTLSAYQGLYMQKVSLSVRALDDGLYGKNSQMSFDANNVQLMDGTKLSGKVQISGFGLNAVFQGDKVLANGKVYPGYGAYQARLSFAQLQLIDHHPSLIGEIRRKFAAGMQSALPEPMAPFAMGLLIGQRATLPAEIKQDLLMVGLTHIIAVSGYNLTIMLHASKHILGKRSKRIGTFLSLGLIVVFLLLAGSSASIVRAAIVSVLSIWAGYYGRNFKPLNLIMLAAAITAWANPIYVWSDISWYLSFLAFYGVMVLAPLLVNRFHYQWRDSLVIMVALESLCAEVMTLPFVLYIFGQISLIGLPANVLVVTLIPLAMLLSLIAGLAGMLAGAVAGWLAWPAQLLLTYMLDVAHVLAQIPHIFIQNLSLSLTQMIGLYAIVIIVTWLLTGKTNVSKPDTITDENQVIMQGAILERS